MERRLAGWSADVASRNLIEELMLSDRIEYAWPLQLEERDAQRGTRQAVGGVYDSLLIGQE
jgi:hypothetical protein